MSAHCYLVVIRREGNGYTADAPDLPGCTVTGATFEQARQNVTEAMRESVRQLQAAGQPIPESLDIEDYRYSWPEFSSDDQAVLGIYFTV